MYSAVCLIGICSSNVSSLSIFSFYSFFTPMLVPERAFLSFSGTGAVNSQSCFFSASRHRAKF